MTLAKGILTALLFALPAFAQNPVARRVAPVTRSAEQAFAGQPRIAVLAAVGNYPRHSGLNRLQYPASDLSDLAASLEKLGYTVLRLADQEATRGAILRAIASVGESIDKNRGTLVFYFSGHGYEQNGKNYLATFEASADDLGRTGLAVDELYAALRQTGAQRQVAWIDACRNDPSQRAIASRSFGSLNAAAGLKALYSTREGRVSFESDDLHHGVFTYFLIKGLNGEAAGADQMITFRDLTDYVTASVRDYGLRGGQPQVPYEAGESTGDFLLAKVANAAPALDFKAVFERGLAFYNRKDYTSALPLLRQAADGGQANAANYMGELYFDGLAVRQDYAEAMRWYLQAADGGVAPSMRHIGHLYYQGFGVKQDYAEALRWYRKAAAIGDALAMNNIGALYSNGQAVKQDYAEAMRWYKKAVEGGDAMAMNHIGDLYYNGHGVEQDYGEALRWYKKAVDGGEAMAMTNLGYLYERGLGVPQDHAEALRWYRKAADGGDASGAYNLAVFYRDGAGVARDYAEALAWFRKAGDAGSADAMGALGDMSERGWGVAKDTSQAVSWYQKGAAAGDTFSKDRLKALGRQ